MKKLTKAIVAVLMVVATVMSLVACGGGLDMSKVKGSYTLSTIDGKSADEYDIEITATVNDKTFERTIDGEKETYDIEVKSNGFEAKQNGEIKFSVAVDVEAGTLKYSAVDEDNKTMEVVLKKN